MKLEDIKLPLGNLPNPKLATAGQPSLTDLEALAAAGVRHVINLRPPSEDHGFDEAQVVAKLGMNYVNIPVAGPADFSDENARKLDLAMAAAGADPVLIHCASSNRVGALLAVRAAHLQGKSTEEALAIGRAAGLVKFEPAVRQILEARMA